MLDINWQWNMNPAARGEHHHSLGFISCAPSLLCIRGQLAGSVVDVPRTA